MIEKQVQRCKGVEFDSTFLVCAVLGLSACGGGGGGGGGNGSDPAPHMNRAPVVNPSSHITSELVSFEGIISASDPDGDRLSLTISTPPSKGSFSSFDGATGVFTYTPDAGQDGPDSFGITASDGSMMSAESTINMEICSWAGTQQFGSADEDLSANEGLIRLADGSMVLSGRSRGQVAADPPLGSVDAWVRKVDCRGNELWTRQFGDASEQGKVIIGLAAGGQSTMALVINQNPATATVFKFDSNSQITMDTEVDFVGRTIGLVVGGAIDPDGDVYVLSLAESWQSSIVTKVSGDTGETLWQRFLEGSLELGGSSPFDFEWGEVYIDDIDFDGLGNAVIVGNYTPFAASRPCDSCGYMLKSDPNGNLLWYKEINNMMDSCGQTRQSWIQRVTVAPDRSIWVAGDNGNAGQYAHVSRFSADGNDEFWTYCDVMSPRRIEIRSAVEIANNGDGLAYGYFSSAALPFTAVLIRLDPNGNVIFRNTVDATLNGNPISSWQGSVLEDEQGLLYLTGHTAGQMSVAAPLGDLDAFLLRMDAVGNRR